MLFNKLIDQAARMTRSLARFTDSAEKVENVFKIWPLGLTIVGFFTAIGVIASLALFAILKLVHLLPIGPRHVFLFVALAPLIPLPKYSRRRDISSLH